MCTGVNVANDRFTCVSGRCRVVVMGTGDAVTAATRRSKHQRARFVHRGHKREQRNEDSQKKSSSAGSHILDLQGGSSKELSPNHERP